MNRLLFTLLFGLTAGWSSSQVEFQEELWSGLILNARVADHWSLWQDMHFVPNSFYITRSGVTYHHRDRWVVTGGYATVLTATPFSNRLIRPEHRPWGQAELRLPLKNGTQLRSRLRYDARFRRELSDATVIDRYLLYHRVRFMTGLRFPLSKPGVALNIMQEALFNHGANAPSTWLDQWRLFTLFEFPLGPLRSMAGYHARLLPNASGQHAVRHGVTIWFLYGIDGRGPAAFCGECE
jgi:hypothetical protein